MRTNEMRKIVEKRKTKKRKKREKKSWMIKMANISLQVTEGQPLRLEINTNKDLIKDTQ